MIVSQLYEKAAFLCKDFLGSADATFCKIITRPFYLKIGKPGKIFFSGLHSS
jgi:hypothetical protein